MKKNICFLLFFLCNNVLNAQIITIPDANFKAILLSASPNNNIASIETPIIPFNNPNSVEGFCSSYNSIDTNNDGEIQVSEASAIKFLNIFRIGTATPVIYDITGISSFVNLIYLSFGNHNVNNFNVSGLSNLTYLNCIRNQINNLNVNGLSNLRYLDCGWNQLSTLNLNSLVNLEYLKFPENNISSVDLSNLNLLKEIDCDANPILLTNSTFGNPSVLKYLSCKSISSFSINLSNFPNLNHLYCEQNQLTTLDLSGLNNLITLSCRNNQITSLNLSNLVTLTRLDCSFNPILFTNINFGSSANSIVDLKVNGLGATSIDFSVLSNLITLECNQNQLTILDLSNNFSLRNFSCHSNNLNYINIKNGVNSNSTNIVSIADNPNLTFICADTGELLFVNLMLNSYSYTNCHVNSYCSFTPGGTFYNINGTNRIDLNNDGCNAQDVVYPNLKLNFTNGTTTGSFISNDSGNYSVPVLGGTHTITPQLENMNYFTVVPSSATINFPASTSPFIQNFCITPNGVVNDLEVIIIPMGVARPGFDATYKILCKNKGNQIENNAVVNFNFNDSILDFVSSSVTPTSQNVNALTWNVGTLVPFQSGEILVTFNVNSPTENPAVNIGDVLNFTASINPIVNDALPNDNTFNFNQIVVGSYDPNDKECLEGTIINPSMIGSYVHYKIRFENTGTYPAQNVVIKDEIDTTKFDISSLQIMDTSHSCVTRITNNKVEFIFENINLPFDDAINDGHVVFKIKTKPTLSVGSTISNLANIYFDYNFPIVTNTATSTFTALNSNEVENKSIEIYPNPTTELINISSKDLIKTIEMYDIQGRLLMTKLNDSLNATLDLSNQNTGTYFVKVITDYGIKIEKVLKK
ncbi:T9SS type A sorting domain-containing protein [Flavobacterium sp.]|uniref:DUF7619 domain-containing protein n=1 Tax=Flavobacterium sp. TaxID=239 RepID=UPI00262F1327|nr:T9SS type A sorting domain-containing protein [Flavobacterium sp.]